MRTTRAAAALVALLIATPLVALRAASLAIQAVGARTNWSDRSGSPEAFAPLLRIRPAEGMPAKRVLYRSAFGDATVPTRRAPPSCGPAGCGT